MNESTLVGPGKKFADYQALEQGKLEADDFIEQLKSEQTRLRDELDERLSYEEFLTRMEQNSRQEQPPTRPDNQPFEKTATNTAQQMTLQDIERIVEQRDQRKAMESNLNTAFSKYAEANGPNFALKLKQQATELGMSEQSLKDMAAANPKAFYKLTGIDEAKKVDNFQTPPHTMVNSDALPHTNTVNQEASYFKELYKTNPRQYWSPAVQNKIMDAVRAGRLDPDDVI